MFAYIKGELAATETGAVIIECGGIGYRLTTSSHSIGDFAASREGEVCAFTHLCVREDALELIGFSTTEELDMFRLLIGVSGVGPKAAVSVLSQLRVGELVTAIHTGDAKRIAKAPNIGPKTAARIILELKDKVAVTGSMPEEEESPSVSYGPENAGNRSEAVQALLGLGYSLREAEEALHGVDTTESLESVMTKVLRKMAGKF